ncbi:MAG: hypothetical protein ACRBBP_09075 [Bdellovibrionales bacterium]
MNFSHYKGLVGNEKVQRFVFAQGNRPAAEMEDGQIDYLSETFLFKEDMDAIYEEISASLDLEDRSVFFIDGKRFTYQELKLKDTSQILIYPKETTEMVWTDLLIPGYVNDWVEARSGIIVFYGSDADFLEQMRLSFSKRRTDVVKGTSIVFSSALSAEQVSSEGHFLTASIDEEGFLSSDSQLNFDSYSFSGDVSKVDGKRVLRLADKGSLVLLNSHWGDISKVWAELSTAFDDENIKNFFFESVVGFVGVKKAESANVQGEVIFEALPMLRQDELMKLPVQEQLKKIKSLVNTDGVSFNQSIHSLVLKRKLSLESAYKVSSNPEELNKFLSESGV